MKPAKKQHFANSGFSLVEVTLAMGIAALGLIAILGLMPQGLEMSRKTAELSVHRQINDQVLNNLNQKRWTDLIGGDDVTTLYFDDQGLETTRTSPTLAIVAEVRVNDIDGRALPAGTAPEPYLARVTVHIATTTNPGFRFGADNRRSYVTTTHYIARTN